MSWQLSKYPRKMLIFFAQRLPVSSWTPGLLWQPKAAQSNLSPGLVILCRKQFSPERPEIKECCFDSTKHNSCGKKLAVRYIFTDFFVVYFLSTTILHFAFILFLFSPHLNAHTPMCPCSLTLDKNLSQTLFIVLSFPQQWIWWIS